MGILFSACFSFLALLFFIVGNKECAIGFSVMTGFMLFIMWGLHSCSINYKGSSFCD